VPEPVVLARRIRILVADAHDIVRQGLKALLGKPGWEVVGDVSNGLSAIEAAEVSRPDIVIVEYCLPGMNGADVARHIRQILPATEILIFTTHDTEDVVRDALSAGAIGYLTKCDDGRQLIAAVEALARHQPYLTPRINETLLRSLARSGENRDMSVLSPRERQVTTLIADGKSCREVGEILGISAKTAETHRAAAMRKAGVNTSAALIRFAIRNKLVHG
jgi:DNA-binding NarL/FixJ family response regulator